jgi:nucleoside-diphosphate-sugar epimerase
MNILITGATGFIGANLCRKLAASCTVFALVRAGSARERLPPGVTPIAGDDGSDLAQTMGELRIDGVIHLASCFIAEHLPDDIERLVASNLGFATRVVDSAVRARVKWLINTSSFWQHFDNLERNPANLYAATKQAFESILDYYRAAFPIRITSLELVDTYGPGDPRRKLVAILQEAIRNGTPLSLSPGEQRMNLVYIDDAVAAYEAAIARAADPALTLEAKYCIHAAYLPPLRELAGMVAAAAGQPLDAAWGGRPYRAREYMTPLQLHPLVPGWAPRYTLEQGLRQLYPPK